MKGQYEDLICIGKKDCEWDFSIRATIANLSVAEMNKLRTMIVVAIGSMEGMFCRGHIIEAEENLKTR